MIDETDQIARCIELGKTAAERYAVAITQAEKDAAWDMIAKADMLLVRARIRQMNDQRRQRRK